jgi:hypothetical protein
MERTYRASTGLFLYTAFLLIDGIVLAWEGIRRWMAGLTGSGILLLVLALVCFALAAALVINWGRLRVVITHEALIVRGERPVRRMYWADVDRVREIKGPAYQLSLRGLLPGPYLPHGLLRGETVLEVVARPAMRIVLRQALIDSYGALRDDVVRSVPKDAELDLHARWWKE